MSCKQLQDKIEIGMKYAYSLWILLFVMFCVYKTQAQAKIAGAVIHQIPFKGNCAQLKNFIESRGACDEEDCRKGSAAFTQLRAPTFSYSYSKKTTQKVKCSCSGKMYDAEDISKCVKECKASLGCFTGICEPVGEGFIKLTSTPYQITVGSPEIHVFMINWISDDASRKCKKALKEWNNLIKTHETVHVDDALGLISKKIKVKNTHYGEGATEEEAKVMLEESIANELKQEFSKLLEKFAEDSNQFHSQEEGKNPDVSRLLCDFCE